MNYNRPELRDRLASEYVLGTLQGRARKRFQRLLKSDRTLRDNVASWEQKLVPMGSPLSAPEPSAKVWKGIAVRVGGGSAKAARPSFFERWFGMRSLAPLAAGLVLGIAITILMPAIRDIAPVAPSDGQLPQSYVGFLQDDKGNPTVLISSLPHGRSVDIKVLRPIAAGPDAVLQLWALPRDGTPFPVGTIPA